MIHLMVQRSTEGCVLCESQEILLVEFRKQLEAAQGSPLKPIFGGF
jgi:hypothetical protein